MHALPAHTVTLVLKYISPLTDVLPPHIISTSLRQRHHFLQLSPSSPADYLCWPSPDNARVVDLLDRLPPQSDQACHPTRYTSDSESTFAHVQISSDPDGLRMLLHWDDTHAWRYHDLRLMPFPSPSFLTPQESFATGSSSRLTQAVQVSGNASSDIDDSYWDSYGAVDQDLTSSSSLRKTSRPDAVREDAYWAQYASVQGSADSTIPSPLPIARKLRPISSTDVDSQSRPGPPSPVMLAHRLGKITPRKDVCLSVSAPSAYTANSSSDQAAADSDSLSNKHLNTPVVSVSIVPEDKALAESIRGLYYLWKSGRKREPSDEDRIIFLQIAHEAIAEYE